MKWVARERPKIDRVARETGATPYDVEGVDLTHDGPRCSFDALLVRYRLDDPALLALACGTAS